MRNFILMMCVALVSGVLAVSPAAADTIYLDDFSGGSGTDLNGTAPDTRPGSETWTASTAWKADGSISGTVINGDNAFLPFVPGSGKVYTLSLDVNPTGGTSWFALGFTNAATTTCCFYTIGNPDPAPWMLVGTTRGADKGTTWLGPGVTGDATFDTTTGWVPLDIVLDTRSTLWDVEWFVGDSSVRTATYTANPTISYVAFGRNSNATGSVDNFELTVVPEPSTFVLLGMGALALLLVCLRQRK